MITNYSKRLVISGLMLALGILLPYVTAHGFGMSGNILLPMHIPVLLCGFLCGPYMGALCGLMLPVLNSLLTGMPALYPMAVIMTCELGVYGFASGFLYKKTKYSNKLAVIYPVLLASLILGRVAYGLAAWLLLLADTDAGKFSVIGAVVTGIPGIVAQLVIIPAVVVRTAKSFVPPYDAAKEAVELIRSGKATCVTVKDNRITTCGSSRGIAYIIDLYEKGELEGAFVADKVVGKAAAMIFSLGGISSCYAENISDSAVSYLERHNIAFRYKNRSDYIVNRTGDGICPMEQTVAEIDDAQQALVALRLRVAGNKS